MKLQEVLLIDEEYVKAYSTVSANLDAKYIAPAITTAQVINLQELIGTKLAVKLCELVEDNVIGNTEYQPYKDLLDGYIQPYLLAVTNAELFVSNYAKLRNSGNMQYLDTNQTNISMKDVQYMKEHYENQADFLAKRVLDFIVCNRKQFPEFTCAGCCDGMSPRPQSSTSCNLNI